MQFERKGNLHLFLSYLFPSTADIKYFSPIFVFYTFIFLIYNEFHLYLFLPIDKRKDLFLWLEEENLQRNDYN